MKITANMVTVARIVLLPVPGYLLYNDIPHLYWAFALIVMLAFTDWLDGQMARKNGATVLGGLLDPIADKIFIVVCFIPFSQRVLPGMDNVVFPLWMLILMFSRDFVVTSLRTSMSMLGVPMRTSVLAKFKTAIQMTSAGYLIAIVIGYLENPESQVVSYLFFLMASIPLAYIVYRLVTGKLPGIRSLTMFSMTGVFAVIFFFADIQVSLLVLAAVVSGVTVFSGISYVIDAWSALKGTKKIFREASKYVLEGFLVPAAFLLPLGCFDSYLVSTLVILGITLELASGGLANLLASRKAVIRFRLIILKGILEVLFAGGAVVVCHYKLFSGYPVGEILISAAASVSLVSTVILFVRNRSVYMGQLMG